MLCARISQIKIRTMLILEMWFHIAVVAGCFVDTILYLADTRTLFFIFGGHEMSVIFLFKCVWLALNMGFCHSGVREKEEKYMPACLLACHQGVRVLIVGFKIQMSFNWSVNKRQVFQWAVWILAVLYPAIFGGLFLLSSGVSIATGCEEHDNGKWGF